MSPNDCYPSPKSRQWDGLPARLFLISFTSVGWASSPSLSSPSSRWDGLPARLSIIFNFLPKEARAEARAFSIQLHCLGYLGSPNRALPLSEAPYPDPIAPDRASQPTDADAELASDSPTDPTHADTSLSRVRGDGAGLPAHTMEHGHEKPDDQEKHASLAPGSAQHARVLLGIHMRNL